MLFVLVFSSYITINDNGIVVGYPWNILYVEFVMKTRSNNLLSVVQLLWPCVSGALSVACVNKGLVGGSF